MIFIKGNVKHRFSSVQITANSFGSKVMLSKYWSFLGIIVARG